MPLVGVVCPNSLVSLMMASYLGYTSSKPARSRWPGESVAAPKYFRPAFFANSFSWPDASGRDAASRTEGTDDNRMVTRRRLGKGEEV